MRRIISNTQTSAVDHDNLPVLALKTLRLQFPPFFWSTMFSKLNCVCPRKGIAFSGFRFLSYSTVQYSTVQYSTVQYSTVQYSTVQYLKNGINIIVVVRDVTDARKLTRQVLVIFTTTDDDDHASGLAKL